jgi:hypothetical protein
MLAKNESQLDRAIRLIVGLVLLIIGSYVSGWLQWVLWILAIYALLTAALGACGLYKIFGWNTNKAKVAREPKTEEAPTAAVEPEAKTEEMNQPTPAAEEEAELKVDEPVEEAPEEAEMTQGEEENK